MLRMSILRSVSRVFVSINNITILNKSNGNYFKDMLFATGLNYFQICRNKFHTSLLRNDLMEFFDDKENWQRIEVRVGRSWKVEELRIKSNSDLHKLWYVLLKEKNMLLTMEHECKRKNLPFPNPERLDKVDESMENLETVVRERNRAYFELETGGTGERPTKMTTNCFGLEYEHKMTEYPIEKRFNKKFLEEEALLNFTTDHKYVEEFLIKLNEKLQKERGFQKRKHFLAACRILSKFPHVDEESLKEEFPDVDIKKARQHKNSRGHHENEY